MGGQMKLGFVSAILDQDNFTEAVDVAAGLGFQCMEVACWPQGGAERRYAGVGHIDVDNQSGEYIHSIKEYCRAKGVEVSALAYYPNPLDPDPVKQSAYLAHLRKVIEMAAKLDVRMVGTFIGRDQGKNIADNIALFRKVWPGLIKFAEGLGVKIAIENCPMLFGAGQWPGGQNLACTPQIWRELFALAPSDYFGLNYDPSHFVWQQMDYIKPLYEFKDKIFHVHFKDIKLYQSRLDEVGALAYPLDYMAPKLPGLGDVNWPRFISALTDIGYDGFACIEVEDRSFEGSREAVLNSLKLSKRYLEQFVI
jgi:sugar phosphate isomerase/epimerase